MGLLSRFYKCVLVLEFVQESIFEITVLQYQGQWQAILHWLALLMKYRQFRIFTPIIKRGADWLKESFLIDLTPYDAVIGYRADDSYFSFERAFVNNEISLTRLSCAMRLGKLGEQFVLKSCAALRFNLSLTKLPTTRYITPHGHITPKEKIATMKPRLLTVLSLGRTIGMACIWETLSVRRCSSMIHAYDNQYLDDAMNCLGEAMD